MRNKLYVLIFLLYNSIYCFSQEKWENKEALYTNYTFSFHWYLPKELEWKKTASFERHTVFKAISTYGAMALVNINPYNSSATPPDVWNDSEKYMKIYEYSWKKVKERTGAEIIPIKVEKSHFAGTRALKLTVKSILIDDVNNEIGYDITYYFHKDNATWSVSLKCLEDLYLSLTENDIKYIFKGFGMNAKAESHNLNESFK